MGLEASFGRRRRSRVGVGIGSSEVREGKRRRRRTVHPVHPVRPSRLSARGDSRRKHPATSNPSVGSAAASRRPRAAAAGPAARGARRRVLGDLARLGGYATWDQVPTGGGGGRRGRTGDLDDASSLLTSPASEADVRRAREASREASGATPRSVHDEGLRAAMAVDVRMRRARMSSPMSSPGGDRRGTSRWRRGGRCIGRRARGRRGRRGTER